MFHNKSKVKTDDLPIKIERYNDSMIKRIENSFISIGADTLGSELVSIRSVIDGFEYLWQKQDESLNVQAPVLFPLIQFPYNI